jgi:hypothetical protein
MTGQSVNLQFDFSQRSLDEANLTSWLATHRLLKPNNDLIAHMATFIWRRLLETLICTFRYTRASQRGQGMLEYTLIIFLVAEVAIVGIVFLVPP